MLIDSNQVRPGHQIDLLGYVLVVDKVVPPSQKQKDLGCVGVAVDRHGIGITLESRVRVL